MPRCQKQKGPNPTQLFVVSSFRLAGTFTFRWSCGSPPPHKALLARPAAAVNQLQCRQCGSCTAARLLLTVAMAVVPTLSPAKAVVKAVKVAKAAVKEVVLVEAVLLVVGNLTSR